MRSTAAWFSSSAPRIRSDGINEFSRRRRQAASPVVVDTTSLPRPSNMGTTFPVIEDPDNSIIDIEEIHRQAILDKQSTYIDPATGFTVFTELAHLKRGKCCGNQCRHCPYGWSNVRNGFDGGFGDASANNNAKAISGDSKRTGMLVKRILDGTYYENDACSFDSSSNKSPQTTDTINRAQMHVVDSTSKGQGKGGSAGGTLTTKNVPYTRTGDRGTAQLFTGERRSKDDIIFEALGTVDELCSIVGVVYAELTVSNGKLRAGNEVADDDSLTSAAIYGDLPEQLLDIMSRLFDVGSIIARPTPQTSNHTESTSKPGNTEFNSHHTSLLEEWIDTMTDKLPELTSFIIPTGSPASAQLHVARTVCRRAERRMVPLVQDADTLDPSALAYVNRLSDYLFTAARFVNYCDDREEVQYRKADRRPVDGGKTGNGVNAGSGRERVVVKLKE